MKLFKSSLLILSLSVINVEAYSQLPDSIALTTNGSWIIQHNEANYGWNPSSGAYEWITTSTYNYYRSGGDTLIDDTTYTQLLGIPVTKHIDGYTASPSADENFVLAYRNDNSRRAFKVPYGTATEELWYDFNYSVGDTMWSPNTLGNHSYLVITDIDSTAYCETNYEQLNFNEIPHNSIQRAGSVINFFHNYADVFIHDEIVFFCEESIPFSAVAGIEEFEELELITFYPNPSKNIVHISTKNDLIPTSLFIQNMAGEIVYRDDSGAKSFSIADFPNGVYLITIAVSNAVYTERLIKN